MRLFALWCRWCKHSFLLYGGIDDPVAFFRCARCGLVEFVADAERQQWERNRVGEST